jgi:hypothetical protein
MGYSSSLGDGEKVKQLLNAKKAFQVELGRPFLWCRGSFRYKK